jgi:hypothetical protein
MVKSSTYIGELQSDESHYVFSGANCGCNNNEMKREY